MQDKDPKPNLAEEKCINALPPEMIKITFDG